MTPFLLVNGWNCETLSRLCRESVAKQTVQPRIVCVDDGSRDGSGRWWKGTEMITNPIRRGAAYSRYYGLKYITDHCEPDDVICLLDMDDRLLPNAIETAMKLHNSGAWATYGGMVTNIRGRVDQGEYPIEVRDARSYRTSKFQAQPFRTFRAKLVKDMPVEPFIKDGQWIEACTDLALMFYVLEQCPAETVQYITEPVYHYNMTNRAFSSYRRVNMEQRTEIRRWVKSRL